MTKRLPIMGRAVLLSAVPLIFQLMVLIASSTSMVGVFVLIAMISQVFVVYKILQSGLNSDRRRAVELERLVQIKTRELKLVVEELERSNQELQDFAAIASHDLQEPLRKIVAFGERLSTEFGPQLSGDGADLLGRILNAVHRMQTLIDDLLALSRITSRAMAFEKTDMKEVVDDVLSDLEVSIKDANADVEVGDMPTLVAEPTQMRQLLQNLIANSLKFRRDDIRPKVRVFIRRLESESIHPETCEIHVEDNGIGFEQKYAEKIFGIFQRLHSRAQYEGTGIGLAVCRKIAERHGGSIRAIGTPQNGATFIVSLPMQQTWEGANVA